MKYFDNSATTPLAPEVKESIQHYMDWTYGNPSSPYHEGRMAKKALQAARSTIADLIGAKNADEENPGEVFFTSSGTESDNLAILGSLAARRDNRKHCITSSIEHPAVLNTFRYLETQGYHVDYLPVDRQGNINPDDLAKALDNETALVSIMMANNEVGTVQPIQLMADMAHQYGSLFHTDAVQALGKLTLNTAELGIDLMSLSAHKIYGPKGIGALYVKENTPLINIMHGGHQENGIRPGTENMLGIVGFAKACELLQGTIEMEARQKERLALRLSQGLQESIPDIELNGNPHSKIPGHVHVTFRFVEGEALLMALNLKEIACSSGSACSTGSNLPSHVLLAMGFDYLDAQSSIRFTVGRYNTADEIDELLRDIPVIVQRLRAMSPLARHRSRER